MPAIIPHGQRNKVIFHNATDIQLVVQTLQGLLMKKFMICISHGTSRITSLSPNQWEAGTSSSDNAGYACQRDAIIIAFFYEKSQDKNDTLVLSKRASLYPRSKERGFRLGNFDKIIIKSRKNNIKTHKNTLFLRFFLQDLVETPKQKPPTRNHQPSTIDKNPLLL